MIDEDPAEPIVIREEDDDEPVDLADIPEARTAEQQPRRSAREKRQSNLQDADTLSHSGDSESSDSFVPEPNRTPSISENHASNAGQDNDAELREDDKKKLGLNTSYDGFSIYGRILCLVIKRRGMRNPTSASSVTSSQAMLENWVSTQAVAEQLEDDEDAT